MRPAFILLAITAFAVARPLETTSNGALALRSNDVDNALNLVVEQALQEWVADHDDFDADDFLKGLLTKAKTALKDVAKSTANHIKETVKAKGKEVLQGALDHAHAKLTEKIAGAGAGEGEATEPPAERRSADEFDALIEQALQEWIAEHDEFDADDFLKGLLTKAKTALKDVAKSTANHIKETVKAKGKEVLQSALDHAHAKLTEKIAGAGASEGETAEPPAERRSTIDDLD